jgi:DNA-binding response OmpR family regulator
MTTPAPYTPATLRRIREAARDGMSIEQCAPLLGWPSAMLLRICRANMIPMRSAPPTASGAARAAAPRAAGLQDGDVVVHGLRFDPDGRSVSAGEICISLQKRTMALLKALLRHSHGPIINSVSAAAIAPQVWPDVCASTQASYFCAAIAEIKQKLPEPGWRVVQIKNGRTTYYKLGRVCEAAEGSLA